MYSLILVLLVQHELTFTFFEELLTISSPTPRQMTLLSSSVRALSETLPSQVIIHITPPVKLRVCVYCIQWQTEYLRVYKLLDSVDAVSLHITVVAADTNTTRRLEHNKIIRPTKFYVAPRFVLSHSIVLQECYQWQKLHQSIFMISVFSDWKCYSQFTPKIHVKMSWDLELLAVRQSATFWSLSVTPLQLYETVYRYHSNNSLHFHPNPNFHSFCGT